MRTWIASTVLVLAAAGCSGDDGNAESTPSPTLTGDAHILSVAEGLGGWNLPDENDIIIELGHQVCDYLDTTDGDFDGFDQQISSVSDDPVVTVRVWTTSMAGIPAYCPEWTDELLAWTDAQE